MGGRRGGRGAPAGPGRSGLGAFLKKRAPVYLGLLALFLVFAVPELTKGDLRGSLPVLPAAEQEVADALLSYAGPDGTGLTVIDAISERIADEYPGERIYDDRATSVSLAVEPAPGGHRVTLDFESHGGVMSYDWSVGAGSITANNPASKHVLDIVDYYD